MKQKWGRPRLQRGRPLLRSLSDQSRSFSGTTRTSWVSTFWELPSPAVTLTVTIDSKHLDQSLPRSMNGEEVDRLTAGFNAMTARLGASIHQIHEFTLHASHELKTPLTVMRMQLETVLRENGSLDPEQSRWIAGQIDEVERLTKIVDSLTLLTKADAGMLRVNFQPVQLGKLVHEAFEDAECLAGSMGITASLGPCEDAVVSGDRHRLRQLLLILFDNAVKHNHPGGRVRTSLRRFPDHAEIRIDNTGTAPKSFETVFNRFERGDNAVGRVDGCGLGLSIARSIAEAHGGGVELKPGTEGEITALVKLPCG